MCGILFSLDKEKIGDLDAVKRRGPENFREVENELGYFAHSLLNTIGKSVPQPLQNKKGVLLYNGSTYNNSGNDALWISQNLDDGLDNTLSVIRSLRGEYALVYVTEKHIVFCADEFHQRNLWFYFSKENKKFTACSIPKIVTDKHGTCWYAQDNKIYVIERGTMDIKVVQNREWNFEQKHDHFDYVFESFENAIKDRHDPAITTNLHSSGTDSGAIDCASLKLIKDYKSIVTITDEIKSLLGERYKKHKFIPLPRATHQPEHDAIFTKIFDSHEHFTWVGETDSQINMYRTIAVKHKHKIVISGNGGDEIYNDHKGQHSNHLKGRTNGCFPENLELFWPWHSLVGRLITNNQRADFVAGWFGIEVRNPLQDQALVQAWLNTTNRLKNQGYKAWMEKYMELNDYPFISGPAGKRHFCNDKY